jgi:hypothetical protein
MTTRMLVRILVALLIAAVLGGASLIIVRSGAVADADVPAGFVH